MESPLYDGIMDSEASLETLATDWISEYEKDAVPALTTLLNFVLKCAGCELPVEQHDVEEFDSANETIAQVQEAAKSIVPAHYPIISKDKQFRGFRNQLVLFFEHLAVISSEKGIMYEDDEFMWRVVGWITLISASHLRAFRHTATAILLHMMQVFCDLQQIQIQNKNKQQAILNRKKLTKQAATMARQESETATQNEEELGRLIGDIHTSVFANRIKDVDDHIRSDCIESLCELMKEYPSKFMDNTYLKYFVGAMTDSAQTTRLAVLRGLKAIYSKVEMTTPLRRFTERYQTRIADIAEVDASSNCRRNAVDVLVLIDAQEVLSEEISQRASALIVDQNSSVRQEAAKFMVRKASSDDYSNEFGDLDEDEVERFQQVYPDELKTCYIHFKRIASDLIELNPDESVDELKPTMVLQKLKTSKHLLPSRVVLAAEAVMAASRKTSGVEWSWTDLINQVTFDFSSLEAPGNARKNRFSKCVSAYEPKEEEKVVLFDMLYGFIVSELQYAAEPKRNGKRREQEEIDSSLADIHSELITRIPKLLEVARYSPSLVSCALRIATLVDPSVYRTEEREAEQLDTFQKCIKQFVNQTDEQVLVACREMFSLALEEQSFEEPARNELQAVLDEISFDLRSKYSEAEIDFDALKDQLTKLLHLSHACDIRDMLETDLVHGDTTLGAKMAETLTLERDETYLIVVCDILRSYAIWKTGGFVTDRPSTREAESTPEHDRHLLQSIISQYKILTVYPTLTGTEANRKKLLRAENNHFQTSIKSALLEVLCTIALAQKHGSLSKYGRKVLESLHAELSDETAREVMALYLEKEEAWAIAAGVTINESEVDELVRKSENEEDDDDEEIDPPHDNDEEVGDEIDLDADLCRIASKIALAGVCEVLPVQYVNRLRHNIKHLSNQYNKVMSVNSSLTNKRKAPSD